MLQAWPSLWPFFRLVKVITLAESCFEFSIVFLLRHWARRSKHLNGMVDAIAYRKDRDPYRWYSVICSGFSTSSRWSLWGVLRFSAEWPVGTRNSWGNREPLAGSAAANRESDPRIQFKPNELLPLYPGTVRRVTIVDTCKLSQRCSWRETSPLEALLRSAIRSIKHSARLTASMYLLIDIQQCREWCLAERSEMVLRF